jgi:pSer/pThr/pTyr-binding forkhead associated (FHA) protein
MSFLLQRASGRSLTLTQVSGGILRIGRGTNQELRSENPAVALEHAVIESDVAGYFITDKGSITGTYVNRKPVESARLAKGDVIEIGDLRLEVQIADAAKPLFIRIAAERTAGAAFEEEEARAVATPGARVVRAKKLDYAGAYRLQRPWLTRLSVTALVLIVTLTLIGLIVETNNQSVFMPGGLSSAHARARDPHGKAVAANCDSCHSPFRSVSSNKCLDCHPHQPHAIQAGDPDCFTCHAEHRGATKLAAIGDATCTSCHAPLGASEFGRQHPDVSYPKDLNTLRFNHKLHLGAKGIFNAQGKREVLECAACHRSSSEFLGVPRSSSGSSVAPPPEAPRHSEELRGILIPDFEQHCQRCHRLTFDARFPDAEVPHGGDPGIVYGFVGGMYSGDRALAGKSAAELRRILTTRRSVTTNERATLNAEQVIKTKCKQCHDVERAGTRLGVTRPVLRTSWLEGAKFTHARHATVGCEDCHEGARGSAATGDVLMPRAADCTGCHGAKGTQAASTCVTCHEYHHRPQRQVQIASLAQGGMGGLGSGGRMLQGILLALIVILLLVVLVPVGIALFQRLKPERPSAPPAQPRPVPPPPPRRVQPDAPTDKVERQAASAPPDITPQAPVPPPVEKTRLDIPPPQERTSAPVGTEMVQWNGMLHCTKGPLEGQRFVIDDDGFYIGRDPVLSKIVIPDSRVSKRHVRIVPRDGKVWAIDEGSTNGTFLKGQRITEVQLKRGDTLVLGDDAATFVYQI